MPENKSTNRELFLFVKAVAITDVPSTRSLSCLAILSWVFSGVTFIRCVRLHPSISPPHDLQSSHEYFMSIFGCDFHPVHSITSRLFDSQVPFTDPFHRSLFRSHASFASLCFSAPLFSFRTVPEQFKGIFWVYPRPLWKSVGESVVMRCILLGIFTEK